MDSFSLVTEFSVSTSQPLRILIITPRCSAGKIHAQIAPVPLKMQRNTNQTAKRMKKVRKRKNMHGTISWWYHEQKKKPSLVHVEDVGLVIFFFISKLTVTVTVNNSQKPVLIAQCIAKGQTLR